MRLQTLSSRWHSLATILLWQGAFWFGFIALSLLSAEIVHKPLQLHLPMIVIVASATLAMVAFALLPLTRFSHRQAVGASFLALIAADAAFTTYSGEQVALLRYVVEYLTISAGAAFIATLAGHERKVLRVLAVVNGLLLIILIAAEQVDALSDLVLWLDPVAVIAVAIYLISAFGRMAGPQREAATRVSAVLLLGVVTMAYDVAVNLHLLTPAFIQATTLFPLYMVAGIAIELALYGLSIHRQAGELNSDLKRKITLQEYEISEAAAKMRAQERLLAVSQERQRLVRDMHDGAGGLLTSLLLRLRNGNVALDKVQDDIQAAIYDLHHIIDSMDCADEGLDIALAIFRERITPRLASHGIILHWEDTASRPLPDIGSQSMIQIYRILQEGVTNALRHGHARQIDMQLQANEVDGRFVLSMTDDGIGFSLNSEHERPRWQRGLTNMSRRAKIIGGELNIISAAGNGTRLELILPD
jgi:signal transduction histidine kinase